MEKHLSKKQLSVELNNHRGLIPVDLDIENRLVRWMDLESYHFYEGFFHKSLDMFAALKSGRSPVTAFTTDFDIFAGEEKPLA